MSPLELHRAYALSLLADLNAPDAQAQPCRDTLLDWLQLFLRRADARGFRATDADVENLIALDQYVRINRIPATPRPKLG
jgi:hypothetical protein